MKAYAHARIITAGENNAADETGKAFHWFTVFLKDDEGAVIEVSSGMHNFEQYEGDSGVCELEIRKQEQKTKIKLVAFTPNETISLPDKEIS